jgi:hypothetical protein
LEAYGCKFGPGWDWVILVGRYNDLRYLENRELSMAPQLSRTSYHLTREYAELEFVRHKK